MYSDEQLRHSAAHLLAHAISELYPGTIFTIGPATETGFFYDMLPGEKNFKEEDVPLISGRMKEIVERDLPLTHYEVSLEKARSLFANNRFKLEIIENQIIGSTAGIAQQGDFIDLCKGGHVPSTGHLKHFILTGISGSYWRGDRSGQPLQRISGIIFRTQEALENHLKQREEAELYDHRKLGKEMDLFSFHLEGPGFPFFHPKGMSVINSLTDYMRKLTYQAGYQEIKTPMMLHSDLWKRSGHDAHYKQNMYFSQIDEQEFAIKPMNCPGAFLTFDTRPRSYRELPLRLSEFGHVHRHELSGVLHGLTRVRAFTQDDAHIFCTHEQIEGEIANILLLIDQMLAKTGFLDFDISISTRPQGAPGSNENWENATNALESALKKQGKTYDIKHGEGAFYGPKIEIGIKDSLQRRWQCGTIQVDFLNPENFDLTYVNAQGNKERPVIIHQAMYGSLERFFAIMLEHHKGNLPSWAAPIQARILPITDAQAPYATSLLHTLKQAHIRCEVDISSDPLNAKIQRAQIEKVPFMIIIGNKEMQSNKVSLRKRDGKQVLGIDLTQCLSIIQNT